MLCFGVMNEEMALMHMDHLPRESQKSWMCRSFYFGPTSGSRATGRRPFGNSKWPSKTGQTSLPMIFFWLHYSLARAFSKEGRPDDAHNHIVQAKSVNEAHCLNYARVLRVSTWIEQRRPERAQPLLARAPGEARGC